MTIKNKLNQSELLDEEKIFILKLWINNFHT